VILKAFSKLMLPVLIAVNIAGCATAPTKVDLTKLAGSSISVASTVGSSINYLRIGMTVFNNEEKRSAFVSEKIDRAIESSLVDALRKTRNYSRLNAVPVQVDAPLKNVGAIDADYLLLVEPFSDSDHFLQSNQHMRGLGLIQRNLFFGLAPIAYMHAVVRISVVRVSTGEVVAQKIDYRGWQSKIFLSSGPSLSQQDTAAFEEKMLGEVPSFVAQMLKPLGLL